MSLVRNRTSCWGRSIIHSGKLARALMERRKRCVKANAYNLPAVEVLKRIFSHVSSDRTVALESWGEQEEAPSTRRWCLVCQRMRAPAFTGWGEREHSSMQVVSHVVGTSGVDLGAQEVLVAVIGSIVDWGPLRMDVMVHNRCECNSYGVAVCFSCEEMLCINAARAATVMGLVCTGDAVVDKRNARRACSFLLEHLFWKAYVCIMIKQVPWIDPGRCPGDESEDTFGDLVACADEMENFKDCYIDMKKTMNHRGKRAGTLMYLCVVALSSKDMRLARESFPNLLDDLFMD